LDQAPVKGFDEAVGDTAHDLANRTHGLVARTRAALEHDGEHAPDPVIVARVRSKLGRVVSRPHAIVVTAHHGRVALSGPVLADEASRLLAAVASVRGVVGVENRLEICQQPGDRAALQGGTPYTGGQAKFR
jgi:osmotically-inducible protein OsmY